MTALCLSMLSFPAWPQVMEEGESRPVTGVYAIELGQKNVLATYLSPLHYTGFNFALSGTWSKAMPFNPRHAVMTFRGGGDFTNMLNPAQTARMVGLNAWFSWGMAWRAQLTSKLQFTSGGDFEIEGGAYYLLRNSNNPVQAMAEVGIAATGSVSYPFKIGKLNLLIADNVRIPSLGVFFCPEYGETYYEIYLGNHKGLAHPGWWGNNFRIDNLLSLTFDFGKTAMTIGYRFRFDTQWANQLDTKIMTNSFVIGVIPGGIGLKPKAKVLPETTIYSIY